MTERSLQSFFQNRMTNLFQLNWRDVANSCVSAVIVAILGYVSNLTNLADLDFQTVISIAVIAFVASLAKKFGSDSSGKFGGVI